MNAAGRASARCGSCRVSNIVDYEVRTEERWRRLAAMTAADAQRVVGDVLDLWQPDWTGDDGEELLLHQRVFARVRGLQ